jgi:hypothetical protein
MPLFRKSSAPAYRGALVKRSASLAAVNYSTDTAIAWDSETGGYDTDNIHDNSTNPSRLSVPPLVTKVRLQFGIRLSAVTAGSDCFVQIWKNGGGNYVGWPIQLIETSASTVPSAIISTPVLSVTGGTDYFEAVIATIGDTSITVEAEGSWFAMEIVE